MGEMPGGHRAFERPVRRSFSNHRIKISLFCDNAREEVLHKWLVDVVATNVLTDQSFIASPAVAGGDLFLRSRTHLFRIRQ